MEALSVEPVDDMKQRFKAAFNKKVFNIGLDGAPLDSKEEDTSHSSRKGSNEITQEE